MSVQKVKEGKRIVGTMLRLSKNSAVALLAKNAGLDFIMPDMEHSTYNFETLANIARVSRLAGIECFVRVSELSKSYVSGALDAGVTGIMVPMIETVEQAKKFVNWAKFMPVGNRGFGGMGDHSQFTSAKAVEFMPKANKETLTIAQIESALAIDNIEEIAAVDGIDALLIGPNDLANSLGIPGDLFHEKNMNAILKTAKAARDNNKIFGLHGPDKMAQMLLDEGLTLLMSNHDAGLLLNAFKNLVEKFKE
ncbi:MAG: aldolase/citrate lyase family protein [Sphaerochaetaceae bacterium]